MKELGLKTYLAEILGEVKHEVPRPKDKKKQPKTTWTDRLAKETRTLLFRPSWLGTRWCVENVKN